jgi:hypothetical protein
MFKLAMIFASLLVSAYSTSYVILSVLLPLLHNVNGLNSMPLELVVQSIPLITAETRTLWFRLLPNRLVFCIQA